LLSLFTVGIVGAVGAIVYKEWGRKLLIVANSAIFLYLFVFYFSKVDMIPMAYLFLSMVCALFFSQMKTKLSFLEQGGFNRKSILLVDDDESILKTLKPVLLQNGYSVLTATSGERGLQVTKRQKPDLIVLDVILPGMKGRQVCQKIKEDPTTKHIPVIFLTSKDSPDDVKAELAVGGISHITKPVNPQQLLEEVKKVLNA
jgi:CheY-like chemotaxis protein